MATGERRVVALLGHPVAHSLSPRMQNAAFAAAGLDWEYVLRDVLPEEVEAAVREVEYANVTTPYKLDAARIDASPGFAIGVGGSPRWRRVLYGVGLWSCDSRSGFVPCTSSA